MNIKVSRVSFLNELLKVSRAVSAKTPLPSLTGIKIEARNNVLYFTNTNRTKALPLTIEKWRERFKNKSVLYLSD